MISIEFIRQNKAKVAQCIQDKGCPAVDIDKLLSLNDKRHLLNQQLQKAQENRNKLTKEEGLVKGKAIKDEIKKIKDALLRIDNEFKTLLLSIPCLPASDIDVGPGETANKVIRTVGNIPKFDFPVKDHLQLGENLDLIDTKTAAEISGSRFTYLKNQAVMLEFALVQYTFKFLTDQGFIPIIPPVLLRKSITEKLGYWQAGGHNDYYMVNEPDDQDGLLYLVGTSEHSVVPYHQNRIFENHELPKRYVAFSTCFRRESGSYGKDVRGIFRVHQFDKVEMVSFTRPDRGVEEHEFFLELEEKLFAQLGLAFQVVQMGSGDLGFPVAKKYDLEVWIPSQNKYRELTSTSTTADFQARRLNIRYHDGGQKDFVHIINGTANSINRPLIAILENFQQKDGSVLIPEVLQPYCGFDKIGGNK